ncbi:MAG: carbohydrate binding family 9 domain-containing protein [Bacteroidetes bacterium]|nr:carbohydrate binding family 9 domain-containing protein [Bacteroidota bacterium]
MRTFLLVLLSLCTLYINAQTARKNTIAVKTDKAPVIDGALEDVAWAKALVIDDFTQYLPLYGKAPRFPSEVRIIYDNNAIYVGAILHDNAPDSIPMQLGKRDDENMNVDYFGIQFDTYDNKLDAFTFIVTAAGVQVDSRKSDQTYDGVWISAVKRDKRGWTAELKIPYSALRFPRKAVQEWGLQITRYFRRDRETDQWSLEKPGADNKLVNWGVLSNIRDIQLPVRLSVTPYLAIGIEHFPDTVNKDISTSLSGGMDLKYGLNESFTLDMTLLPDFSQVQSDNKVKNLTAFETVYAEQRPFFKEAVDLFQKGDLFYSRRIGKTPEKFQEIGLQKDVIKNPIQQNLVNATKISGRNKSGLAIGLLNALTANTWATIEDSTGNKTNVLTDPASNYNLLVFDQALKHNSEIYLSNSNLMRSEGYSDANVTAAGITLNNRKNTYAISLNSGLSQNFRNEGLQASKRPEIGIKYFAGIAKTTGNFQFTLIKGGMNSKYDANGMGITLYNNYNQNYASFTYNIYKPVWLLRDFHSNLVFVNENNYTTGKTQKANLQLKTFATSLQYLSMWVNFDINLFETYDYYEPRLAGRYYLNPQSAAADFGISSDYRKAFALDAKLMGSYAGRDGTRQIAYVLHPIIRVSNHFNFDYEFNYDKIMNQYGYADTQTEDRSIIFGKRDVTTIINTLTAKYLFTNNLSFNLVARHYWSMGKYKSYYTLMENGLVTANTAYNEVNDFNFNAFTTDMVFSWIFAPGSSINVVWKNSIDPGDNQQAITYFDNFRRTFEANQRNTLSFKILYYLDYQDIIQKLKSRR